MQKTQIQIETIGPEKSYAEVLAYQEACVAEVLAGGPERLLLVEHAPVFTLGTGAKEADVLDAGPIPTVHTGRGGQVTYHGPGQRVVYPILNLRHYRQDVRWYVKTLQSWLIEVLAEQGLSAFTTDDVGVWVNTPAGEAKIAAIGIRVRRWVTFHGIALNVCPDLTAYERIIPCGISDKAVTSLQQCRHDLSVNELDFSLVSAFLRHFNQA